jgi:hypothetical protein
MAFVPDTFPDSDCCVPLCFSRNRGELRARFRQSLDDFHGSLRGLAEPHRSARTVVTESPATFLMPPVAAEYC